MADLQSYNFAQEPAAIQSILSYDIPKTFVGKYAAYDIPFTKKDFEILSQCKPTIRKTLYRRAKQWKIRFKKLSPEVWERIYGKDQNIISYPYDLITAVSIVREDMFVKQKIGNLELIGQKPLPIAIKNIPACKKHIFTIFKK